MAAISVVAKNSVSFKREVGTPCSLTRDVDHYFVFHCSDLLSRTKQRTVEASLCLLALRQLRSYWTRNPKLTCRLELGLAISRGASFRVGPLKSIVVKMPKPIRLRLLRVEKKS
jgi:hypothetical protein